MRPKKCLALFRRRGRRIGAALGQVVEHGNAQAVIDQPQHPYTQLLISSIPIPAPDVKWEQRLEPVQVEAVVEAGQERNHWLGPHSAADGQRYHESRERMTAIDRVTVGLVQTAAVLKDKQRNIQEAIELLEQLAGQAMVACLPELFTTGYHLDLIGEDFYRLAETIPGETTEVLGEVARRHQMAIIGGVVERDPEQRDRLFDSLFVLDAAGQLVGRYRKTHLYPAEHRYFQPGEGLGIFNLGGVGVGTTICFEHAFPAIFTTLALQGAQVIFIPSAVPCGYEYLLNLRTRARAQDNQLFVVAVNRVGTDGDVTFCGGSQVVNPRGEVIAMAPADRSVALAVELDLQLIEKERRQEPVLANLRPTLYRLG
jgi:predicted amidohydrolase